MSSSSPALRLVLFPFLWAASAVLAQTPPVRPAPAGVPEATTTTDLGYRSAFEGYQPFADGPPAAWREANDTVRRRGGWNAYAAEASRDGPSPPVEPAHAASHRHEHGPEQGQGHSAPASASGPVPSKDRP